MSKPQLKFVFFLVGAAILIPLAFIGFSLLSQFVTQFNQGAVPASIFHGNSLFIPSEDQAQWLPNPPNYNSLLPSQAVREEIIGTYWEAWEALARACVTRDPSALPTYWAGGAFQQVKPIIQCDKGTTLSHLGHRLRLQFFSDDGTVVRFTDEGFHFSYIASGTSNDLPADAAITMTLDTGVWRVRHLEISLHS